MVVSFVLEMLSLVLAAVCGGGGAAFRLCWTTSLPAHKAHAEAEGLWADK